VQPEKAQIVVAKANVNLDMVLIKGGHFMMGSDVGESNERPMHSVSIRDFYMSKTEVTVGQYRKCVEAGVCSLPHWDDGSCYSWNGNAWVQGVIGNEFKGENQPVVCVDWGQARVFAKWAGGDLPSEAQWEYASRSGGEDIKYPWGNEDANCDYVVMWDGSSGCGRGQAWEVCSLIKGNTRQGLCDMAGNVWEWVLDEYHNSYNNAPIDEIGWCIDSGCASNTLAFRVNRGGSWYSYASTLRLARRSNDSPVFRYDALGFRVAKSIQSPY
jgi:formylglycine-generating enzyme required for sulfatase activity